MSVQVGGHLHPIVGLRNYRPRHVTLYGTVKSTAKSYRKRTKRNRKETKKPAKAPIQVPEDIVNKYVGEQYTMAGKKPYTSKKRYRRRGKLRKRIPKTLTPLSKLIRVRATQYFAQNVHTAGALQVVTLQQNSCDDPFGPTGGTGQPLGYDQWKALYKKAYIVGSKLMVTFHNTESHSMMVGITPMPFSQGTTALTDYEYYKEYKGTKSRILSPDMDHGVLVSKVSTKKFHNIKDITDNDDYQLDLVNETPPSKLAYYHVWTQPTNQSSADSASGVECVCDMEYIVLLVDPIIPARSVET